MADGLSLLPLSQVPDGALLAFTTATATTREEECAELVELASGITASQLQRLRKVFSAPNASWSALTQGKPSSTVSDGFLALMMALLSRNDDVKSDAAACFLAALRCPGATAYNVFHPLAFFELAKVLRSLLIGGDAGLAGKAKKSKKPAAIVAPAPAKSRGSRSRPGSAGASAADADLSLIHI